MLIWKVVAASPGITRQGIWQRVEHDIPAGYARRLYPDVVPGPMGTTSARSRVLTNTLGNMCRHGSMQAEGAGRGRRFTVARPLGYHGNPDMVDEPGTRAADHLAEAKALLVMEKALTRAKPGRAHQSPLRLTQKEYEALVLVVRGLRAKGSGSGP